MIIKINYYSKIFHTLIYHISYFTIPLKHTLNHSLYNLFYIFKGYVFNFVQILEKINNILYILLLNSWLIQILYKYSKNIT